MKQAIITCQMNYLRLDDLGIELVLGQSTTLSEDRALASRSLHQYRKMGGLTVRWAQVAREIRSAEEKVVVQRARPRGGLAAGQETPLLAGAPDDVVRGLVRGVMREELQTFKDQVLNELRAVVREALQDIQRADTDMEPKTSGGQGAEDASASLRKAKRTRSKKA